MRESGLVLQCMFTPRSALLQISVQRAYASLSVVLPRGLSAVMRLPLPPPPTSRLSIHERYWWCMKARGLATGTPITAPLRSLGSTFSLITLRMTSIPWISMPCCVDVMTRVGPSSAPFITRTGMSMLTPTLSSTPSTIPFLSSPLPTVTSPTLIFSGKPENLRIEHG